MPPATHKTASVSAYRRLIAGFFILASGPFAARAAEPPVDLARRVAEREAACQELRGNYTFRQSVTVQEVAANGGMYRETRDVIFSPTGERTDKVLSEPRSTLKRLILTAEDFEDIRNIQPMLIIPEMLPRYTVRFRGEEDVDGIAAWVMELTPRQVFQGFRMFDGLIWASQSDLSIVRIHGRAVPNIQTRSQENLFPAFTTIRERIDGDCWFPTMTWADDTLPFRNGPLRMKLEIRYSNYKRFRADSTITFDPPAETKQPPPPERRPTLQPPER